MLSQLQAVTMQSQSDLSPLLLLAAESPLMNLHFMNRRRQLRTKDAGIVDLELRWIFTGNLDEQYMDE